MSEARRLALEYVDTLFRAGDELLETFASKPSARRKVIRIGAMATLSRNFQLESIRPVLAERDIEVVL